MEKDKHPHQEDVSAKHFKTTGFPKTREKNSPAIPPRTAEKETSQERVSRKYQRDSLGMFLEDIDRFPLLDNNGIQAKILFQTLKNHKVTDEESKTESQIKREKLEAVKNNPEFWKVVNPNNPHQEPELFDNAFKESRSIEEFMIHCNLRLLFKVSSQMRILSTEDKLQAGFIGLNKAIKYFDPEKGRFSTIATRLIQQEIGKTTLREHRMIRMSNDNEKALSHVKKAVAEFASIYAREPDMAEIEVFLKEKDELPFNLIKSGIQIYSSNITNIASLDMPISSPGENVVTLKDVLAHQPDKSASPDESIESTIHNSQVKESLNKALSALTPTEMQVIKSLYGLDDKNKKGRQQIAEELELSSGQLIHIRTMALKKLRNNPELAAMLSTDDADQNPDKKLSNKPVKPQRIIPEVDFIPPGVRPETHAFIQEARNAGILKSLDKEAKILLYKYFGTDTSLYAIADEKKYGSKVTVGRKIKKILNEIWEELPETITEKYVKEVVIQLKDLKGRKASEEKKKKISETRKKMFLEHPELKDQIKEMRKNDPRVAEQIKNLAEMHRGVPRTKEEKAKMSASHRGHKASPETRAKLSKARKGLPKTAEHKRAISEGLKQAYAARKNEKKINITLFETKSHKK